MSTNINDDLSIENKDMILGAIIDVQERNRLGLCKISKRIFNSIWKNYNGRDKN